MMGEVARLRDSRLSMAELGKLRREVAEVLETAEAAWIAAGEALDTFMN